MPPPTETTLDLRAFDEQKSTVDQILAEIESVASQFDASEIRADIQQTRQALRDDSFRIVVVGEFSRGKSTVINALLGDRVLPSSVLPSTAVLSRIRYSEVATFRLIFPDNRPPEEISHEEFMLLVAPPEPIPGDQASLDEYEARISRLRLIDRVDVTNPSALCRKGVEIIDTPGTNSLDPLHEKITYEFLPRADAIIFVLSAKMFLAQTELDFLSKRILKQDVQRIFFLANFADHLRTDADLQKILDRAQDNLAPLAGDPKLFLVCARAALAHRRLLHGVQTSRMQAGQAKPIYLRGVCNGLHR